MYSGENGHATGFFLNHGGTTYIITNKHALNFTTRNGDPLKRVRIYTRTNQSNILDTDFQDLRLHDDGEPTWLSHDEPGIDVAAIPLEPPVIDTSLTIPSYDPLAEERPFVSQNLNGGNLALTLADAPTTEELVNETAVTAVRGGSRAMILGYPLYVQNNYLPLARNALISSPYGEAVNQRPFFRTDARTHDGLSGGPVITTVSDSSTRVRVSDESIGVRTAAKLLRDVEWHFIGIHAQSSGQGEALGLNDAFYPHSLAEMLPDTG